MSETEQQQEATTTGPASDPLRVGLLGASRIAHKIWAAIEAAGGIQVTMVAARDPARAHEFIKECAESLGLPECRLPVAATYEELVSSPNVDVVYISIPVTKRNEWVLACAEHSKHVIGEKPPAVDGTQLRTWLEALAAKRLLYGDGTMFSHGPYIESVIAAMPKVGRVRRLTANFSFMGDKAFFESDIRCDPALEPMGCLGDVGWYSVRAILHAMNFAMPIAVVGRVLERNAKGAIMAFSGELTFGDPANPDDVITGHFYSSFVASDENVLIISGTEGTIVAPQIILPVTDEPTTYTTVRATIAAESTELRVTRNVETVAVPQETGHTQETQMWRNVRDAVRRDTNGHLAVDEVEAQNWARHAWTTQCILDKLLESATSHGAAGSAGGGAAA